MGLISFFVSRPEENYYERGVFIWNAHHIYVDYWRSPLLLVKNSETSNGQKNIGPKKNPDVIGFETS